MKINRKVKFTVGISYKKHLKKAKDVFENEVLPQLEKDNFVKREQENIISTLTPAQKAHLNCQSHI